ncbi:hypothetical protein A71_101 [Escherichia phage A7_1]|uniref:I-spanin n=1 Tax=Escherichia phage A5-4 TaxID=2996162 RepID=A0AAE9TL20_9CAUD|nr:hypothetical protein A71_101 [Escherichia phage A7_1]UZZ64455.1 hypothetical protein A54_215 [Escherichia phage A5-4]
MLPAKKYFIYAMFGVALFTSGKLYLGHVESVGYDKGYDAANTAWIKKATEYKGKLDSTLEENKRLNEELSYANAKRIIAEEKLRDEVEAMRIDYAKSKKGQEIFMDDEIVDIYNKSLGE